MLYKFDRQKLDFIKVNVFTLSLKIVSVFGFILIGTILSLKPAPKSSYNVEDNIILIGDNDDFTEEKLIKLLKELNFKFPHIVLAQAKIESGGYKSKIFKHKYGTKELSETTKIFLECMDDLSKSNKNKLKSRFNNIEKPERASFVKTIQVLCIHLGQMKAEKTVITEESFMDHIEKTRKKYKEIPSDPTVLGKIGGVDPWFFESAAWTRNQLFRKDSYQLLKAPYDD